MPAIDPAWIALIGTLLGGVGLKIVESWLGRGKVKADIGTTLQGQITVLMNRIDEVEKEVTQWRGMYYKEQEKVAILRVQIINLGKIPADMLTPAAVDAITEPPPDLSNPPLEKPAAGT